MIRVFIDGREGTTGLRIFSRLSKRDDIEITVLGEEERKVPECRARALNSCDLAFLCLPDAAAREAVNMIENPDVRVIDASTAHRCLPDWAYGFPELSPLHRQRIKDSKRVCVPGCHASGFISLVYPLIAAGALDPDAHIACHSLTGYSGGGKKMIAQYEEPDDPLFQAPRPYSLLGKHKHLPEMTVRTGLTHTPSFVPIVDDYYSGMLVAVQIFRDQLTGGAGADRIIEIYEKLYAGPVVNYVSYDGFNENGFASACAMSEKDGMQITVAGSEDNILLMSRFDNLGKGASGAAVQCMNIMLGLDETTGLEL